jgi:hypothetical protein
MNIAYVSGVLRENRSPDAEGITTLDPCRPLPVQARTAALMQKGLRLPIRRSLPWNCSENRSPDAEGITTDEHRLCLRRPAREPQP